MVRLSRRTTLPRLARTTYARNEHKPGNYSRWRIGRKASLVRQANCTGASLGVRRWIAASATR